MSGAPKKLHEEVSQSTPAKRHLDESSLYLSPSGKLIQPGSSDFHGSSEHDGRSAKIQRVESHDDKRPSLAHWMPVGSQKEKESNLREKDSAKKESFVVVNKENLLLKKIASVVAVKPAEHENTAAEMNTLKDDASESHDRDPKDKKREKDVDTGDRHDRSSKYNDKEPLIRSRMCDGEGSPGKSEVSAIVYKPGECVQELLKSWKRFEATPDSKTAENQQNGPTLEIRIPAKFVTSTNRQVKSVQLWGTDVYTNDSDLVAVLMHTGYCSPTSSPPPSAIQELRASVRVLPPQESYISTLRNNVRSCSWGGGIDCSFRIELCCIVKKGGGTIDLEPLLRHTSAVEPTLAPAAVERTITTRAVASVVF